MRKAIESALCQSFTDWELLVINDGSKDNSEEIARGFNHSRIKIIHRDENKGLVFSLNEGLEKTSGEFIARLDADDEWSSKEKLQKQFDFLLARPQAVLVGTWAKVFNDHLEQIGGIAYPCDDKNIRKQILLRNCFIHSSVLARKSAILEAGCYKAEEYLAEDYGLWLRLGKRGQFFNLPIFAVNYRKSTAGITQTNRLKQISVAFGLAEKYKNDYPNFWLAKIKWGWQKFYARIFWS